MCFSFANNFILLAITLISLPTAYNFTEAFIKNKIVRVFQNF